MKVLIADKLLKIRSALRLLIEQEIGGQVVGEASSAPVLFRQLVMYKPDLLILDWDLPGLEESERITPIRELCPDLKVIAVRGQGAAREAGEIIGADAVISKGDSPERVLASLRSFSQPGSPFSRSDRMETKITGEQK